MASVTKASIKAALRRTHGNYMDNLADSLVSLSDTQTISGNTTQNALIMGVQTVAAAGSDQAGAGAIVQGSGAVVIATGADNTAITVAADTINIFICMDSAEWFGGEIPPIAA